jgi:hypothetical protein
LSCGVCCGGIDGIEHVVKAACCAIDFVVDVVYICGAIHVDIDVIKAPFVEMWRGVDCAPSTDSGVNAAARDGKDVSESRGG